MPEAHSPHTPPPTSRRWPAVLSTALLIVVCLAAGASAQLNLEEQGVDTDRTPVAKETTAWLRVAGAKFGVDGFPENSPTPIEAEFYTVAFEHKDHGFAGGSQCKEPPASTEDLDTCPREPIIYEFIGTDTGGSWRPVLPPTGDGYVGGIAFMRDGTALAVGGTGTYPKREPPAGEPDPAGEARAWLYKSGFWSELREPKMQPGMRGMTALAMSPRTGDCGDGAACGLAGGYRQLWMWKDGSFTTGWDTADDPADGAQGIIDDPAGFRFRVRQIAFRPGSQPHPENPTDAVAVTSGCCDANPALNTPRLLVFDTDRVFVKSLREVGGALAPNDDAGARRDLPDSLYSVVLGGFNTNENNQMSIIATPGGPPGDAELPSRITGATNIPAPNTRVTPAGASPPDQVSTVRLTAGAGKTLSNIPDDPAPSHTLDWAVGSLSDTGQAIALTTVTEGAQAISLDCPGADVNLGTIQNLDPACRPYDANTYVEGQKSKRLLRLTTYGLNAFTFSDETESVGWAVGDRGAIVRLGGVGTTSGTVTEPKAPRLGTATPARFTGSEVYDAFRPLPTSGDVPHVPSLASNGTEQLERPQLIAGGSPNPAIPKSAQYAQEDVTSVVMSPDGSEGWAVGGGYSRFETPTPLSPMAPTLYHYDGARWSRCDIRGVPGLLPADPACASLAGLFDHSADVNGKHVLLRQMVRVPLENDEDPSNDDEFEVVAVGTKYDPPGELPIADVVVRYRDGRWSVDEAAQKVHLAFGGSVLSVAFTSPNDGWITTNAANLPLWHWDGTKWWNCNADAAARQDGCDDDNNLLPFDGYDETHGSLAVAGERVYYATARDSGGGVVQAASLFQPAIFYKDPGGTWTAVDGGYDPSCVPQEAGGGCSPDSPNDPATQGKILSLTVADGPSGPIGWAVGDFGADAAGRAAHDVTGDVPGQPPSRYYLLRLSGGKWTPYNEDDASRDYLRDAAQAQAVQSSILDPATGSAAIYMQDYIPRGPGVLLFDPARGETGRWRVFETPFHMRDSGDHASGGFARALVSDGNGGAWFAGRQWTSFGTRQAVHFWHYTDEAPKPVFEEAPHPIREAITGGAAGADGSFWVTTNSSFVYRYDRLTGWDRLRVPGWDPGRIVTRSSEANAVAVGPDGDGLIVGKDGRIAQVSPLGVRLDPAAGKETGHSLRAVAIASDGSAFAGGDGSTLLYRPAGGQFRELEFGGAQSASIKAISMPSPDRVWLADSLGQVHAGTPNGDGWSFRVENRPGGKLLSLDENSQPLALRGIDIDQNGEGYAVGERGLILERRGDGGWQRIKTGFLDTLRSVALAPQGRAGGALIGGDTGLVLTLEDGEFRVAREADLFDPLNFGAGNGLSAAVLGVAIVPGVKEGQVEAWAVQQVPQALGQARSGPGAVLHYTSDPSDPLLRPARIEPLPDTPAPRAGEITFAAFGRSDCQGQAPSCPESAGNLFNEVVSRRVANEVIARAKEPGGPSFAVFTGDVSRGAGKGEGGTTNNLNLNKPLDRSFAHRRWVDQVASRFDDADVPLFGAIGLNDLDRISYCASSTSCPVDTRAQATGKGLTTGWRRAMAGMAAPWGTGPVEDSAGLRFKAVEESGEDVASETLASREEPAAGGARTHYAVDVCDSARCTARLIFLDNSMQTLASSDPNQNPLEPNLGQTGWLERMLSDLDEGQQPIVVMNYPTYAYGAGDPTSWAGDGTALESTFMSLGVKMVVSGRLGWNGRSWATAPGVHHPCPGDPYIDDRNRPEPGAPPDCTAQAAAPEEQVSEELANAMQGLGPPAPPPGAPSVPGVSAPDTGLQGLLPMVVASSAGGTFGPTGTDGGPAGNGWWHGYTIVRMDKSGDPAQTIVEQRPVFDWVSITAPSHVLKPRQRMTLIGEGREPVGIDVAPRYDRINSHAITHRYDLVMADEKNPSIPARKANGDYIPVTDRQNVGEIDPETGVVTAGSGRHERMYTIAILSVGDKAAGWPIAFEPAKSFEPVASVAGAAPNPAPSPPATVVLNQGPAPASPPPPPPGLPQINVPPLNLPPPPVPPTLPTPTATPTPTPPPPPPPPPPPGDPGALPLSLEAPLTPISIVPTVIPPTPPPVNPAPPSGGAARKEARQRQAATAKSEEGGGDQGAGEGQSSGDNGAAQMTRRDPTRPAPSYGESSRDDRRYSFTALSHAEQPSAWGRGALYGGMTLATALALALGWGIARPTPRRRNPPRPAPATVRNVTERRRDH